MLYAVVEDDPMGIYCLKKELTNGDGAFSLYSPVLK